MPCADGSGMQVRYETTNELALVSLSFLFLVLPRVGRAAEQAFEDAALLGGGLSLFFDLVHVFLALAKPKGHFPFQAIAADAQSHGLAGTVFTQPAVRMSRKSGAIELDQDVAFAHAGALGGRSEERRVGKECRSRWS